MSPALAGFTVGIPLARVLGVYAVQRGKALVVFFQGTEKSLANIPEKAFYYLIVACFVGAAFLFGVVSGLVYSWVGTPAYYYLAFGLAVALSLLALVIKTPLKGDKIFWNLVIGCLLGFLVPILAG